MYKGERIDNLLRTIDVLEKTLTKLSGASTLDQNEVAQGYATLAIAKAKLKSLQGESNGTQEKSC
jgi:uncharacterized coiled-coil protein SlyX